MPLEHEPDRRGAILVGPLERVEPLPADLDRAGVGPVERADEVQDRALPRPGRTGERDELAGLDAERDVAERGDAAALEALPHPVDDDRGAGGHARGVTWYETTRFDPPEVTTIRSVSGIPRESAGQMM